MDGELFEFMSRRKITLESSGTIDSGGIAEAVSNRILIKRSLHAPTERTNREMRQLIAHEFGHHIEFRNRELLSESVNRVVRRLSLKKTDDIAGIGGRTDYHHRLYRSKDSRRVLALGNDRGEGLSSSEMVSRGIELIYRDPKAFAQADPDYFDFIYTKVLRYQKPKHKVINRADFDGPEVQARSAPTKTKWPGKGPRPDGDLPTDPKKLSLEEAKGWHGYLRPRIDEGRSNWHEEEFYINLLDAIEANDAPWSKFKFAVPTEVPKPKVSPKVGGSKAKAVTKLDDDTAVKELEVLQKVEARGDKMTLEQEDRLLQLEARLMRPDKAQEELEFNYAGPLEDFEEEIKKILQWVIAKEKQPTQKKKKPTKKDKNTQRTH